MVKSTVTIILSIVFLTSSAAAAWTINDLDDPYSKDQISKGNQTVQVIEVLNNDDDPVNKSGMSDHDLDFKYNDTEGEPMKHLTEGYWYAKFDAKHNQTDRTIEYELIENSPSAEEINKTETLTSGNLTINLDKNLDQKFEAGEEITVEVEVIDSFNGTVEDNAAVDIYFANGSWTSTSVELGWNGNRNAYRSLVQIPDSYNASFVTIITASNSSLPYDNSKGSLASITDTYAQEFGEITELSTEDSGCNNKSFFEKCERGTSIDVGFNVSIFSSSRTDLELHKIKKSDGEWVEHDVKSMSKNDGVWETEFEYPDINTSEYDSKVVMRINSTINGNIFTMTRNISSKSYKIRDKSEPTAYLGDNYKIKASFAKFYSLEPLNKSRFNEAYFTVRRPNNSVFSNFSLSEMEYKDTSGLLVNDLNIPVDADNGSYSTEMNAWNTYDRQKNQNSGFTVEDIQSSFDVNDSMEIDINKTKVYNTTIELTGNTDTDKVVSYEFHDDIENFTEVNDGKDIHINGTETVNPEVEFNISYVEDYDGDIKFIDEEVSYNSTVDVELEAPICQLREEALCMNSDSWINKSTNERKYIAENVTLLYLGDEEGDFISTDVSGDINDHLTINPFSYSVTHSQEIELNFSALSRGNFTGDINFTTSDNEGFLTLGTKLESNVEAKNPDISISGDYNLEDVQGSTSSLNIQLENTGDVTIDRVSASSPVYTVSTPFGSVTDRSIEEGETVDLQLVFQSVSKSEGKVTIEASTSEGSASETITVTANITESEVNYEDKVANLRSRINELKGDATGSTTGDLESLSLEVTELQSEYESGNIQSAEQRYERMSAEVDQIEDQIYSEPNGGDQNGTSETEPPANPNQDSGGGIVIPLIIVLLVVLISGFVVYTSYIPEEGDPLYSVLGGE